MAHPQPTLHANQIRNEVPTCFGSQQLRQLSNSITIGRQTKSQQTFGQLNTKRHLCKITFPLASENCLLLGTRWGLY